MKNLIPLMALLVLGASFSLESPVYAGKGKKCEKKDGKKCDKASADDCCKDEKAKSDAADTKAAAGKGDDAPGDAPAEAPSDDN